MKKLFSIFMLCCFIITSNYSQSPDKTNFTVRMNNHITRYLSDDKNMAKAKEVYGHTCDIHHVVTEEEIKATAAEAEKHAFIQANMDEYMKLYFPEQNLRSTSTTVEICDNGGFEQDFLHYTGYRSQFSSGSTTCNPIWQGTPSVFVPIPLPSFREFEIMSPGVDPITGLQRVKFGQKSLKINDPYLHTGNGCGGSFGINRLKKEFLVTEDNREFTVWYSIAIENPLNHNNQTAFLSIKCDLAPYTDLCFDADLLDCDSLYSQPGCVSELMDVLDWTCHRIKIPKSEIGNIATLEITMADCGQGAHNGYAYIDGICENNGCIGGAIGSVTLSEQTPMVNGIGIEYESCNGDIARICGSYTDPTLCGTWQLNSIDVPGYTNFISNVSIDTINKRFCFDINKNAIGTGSSAEIFVAAYFKKNGGGYLPVVFSNSIYIYKNLFTQKHNVEFSVTGCFDNKTLTNISDDYYMVEVKVVPSGSEDWDISRMLINPYPGESGISQLDSGSGYASLILGPFLIQEGSWEMTVTVGNCTYTYIIDPPNYCSGCNQFRGIEIGNITCLPESDQWTFTVNVPPSTFIGGSFVVSDLDGNPIDQSPYGTPITINNTMEQKCFDYKISDVIDGTCFTEFTVCPPIPCSDEECMLDVQATVECIDEGPEYVVNLTIDNQGPGNLCVVSPDSYSGGGVAISTSGQAGPFVSDATTLVIYTCPSGDCDECTKPTCYKVIKIFAPDCSEGHYNMENVGKPKPITKNISNYETVSIIPNPINNHEMNVVSKMVETSIKVFGVDGKIVHTASFGSQKYTWDMTGHPSGVYVLQYIDDQQTVQSIKFIKQ